jgi:hypothetical protein
MARLNEILVGRFARGLQKVFGMKGEVPVASLAPEVMPVHSLMSGIENRYLEGWDLYSWTAGVAAVAAQQGCFRLRNPPTSNVLAVVVKASVFGALTDGPQLQQGAVGVDFAVAGMTNVRLDSRGRPSPTLIFSTSNAGNPPVSLPVRMQASFPANASVDYILHEDMEIPLLPGDAIQFQSNVANQNLNGCFTWRERFLEESERT